VSRRVVFDTNIVVSALLFANSRLAWLRSHWRQGECIPLISHATAAELARVFTYPVFTYPKFRLSSQDRLELLGDYLPYCETVESVEQCPVICRDTKDQMFLDLAYSGRADVLVSGDQDLLVLTTQAGLLIEPPEAYWQRIFGGK
jgi:putative PIN family toxin of toxin-antitoxin system